MALSTQSCASLITSSNIYTYRPVYYSALLVLDDILATRAQRILRRGHMAPAARAFGVLGAADLDVRYVLLDNESLSEHETIQRLVRSGLVDADPGDDKHARKIICVFLERIQHAHVGSIRGLGDVDVDDA